MVIGIEITGKVKKKTKQTKQNILIPAILAKSVVATQFALFVTLCSVQHMLLLTKSSII